MVERLISKPLPENEVPQPDLLKVNAQFGLELLVNHLSDPASLPDVTSTKAPQGSRLARYMDRAAGSVFLRFANNTGHCVNVEVIPGRGTVLQCRPFIAVRFAGFQLQCIRTGLRL